MIDMWEAIGGVSKKVEQSVPSAHLHPLKSVVFPPRLSPSNDVSDGQFVCLTSARRSLLKLTALHRHSTPTAIKPQQTLREKEAAAVVPSAAGILRHPGITVED